MTIGAQSMSAAQSDNYRCSDIASRDDDLVVKFKHSVEPQGMSSEPEGCT